MCCGWRRRTGVDIHALSMSRHCFLKSSVVWCVRNGLRWVLKIPGIEYKNVDDCSSRAASSLRTYIDVTKEETRDPKTSTRYHHLTGMCLEPLRKSNTNRCQQNCITSCHPSVPSPRSPILPFRPALLLRSRPPSPNPRLPLAASSGIPLLYLSCEPLSDSPGSLRRCLTRWLLII